MGRATPQALDQRTILILNSYHLTFPWSEQVLEELTGALTEAGISESDIIVRFFDSVRVNEPEIQKNQAELLFKSLKPFDFDLIITQDDYALQVLSEHYKERFFGTRVVFCGVSSNHQFPKEMRPYVTGVWENSDENGPLKQILSVHPDTRKVVLLHGANPTALAVADLAREELADYPEREFSWIDGRSLTAEEAWAQVEDLPENALLISLGWKYGTDRRTTPLQDWLSLDSPVPVYLLDDFADRNAHGPHHLGFSRVDPSAHGRRTADYALRILEGASAPSLPFDKSSRRQLFLHRTAFEDSGIALGKLPPKTVLLETEQSLVARHRTLLLVGLASVLALLVGISAGHAFARRRKTHQIARLQREREQFRGLFEGIHDIIFICRPDQTIVECNDQAVQVLGKPRDAILGRAYSEFEVGTAERLELRLTQDHALRVQKQAVSIVEYSDEAAEMHIYHDLTETLSHQKAMHRASEALALTNEQLTAALQSAEQSALEAREANAAKTRFLANISHEIRTPLNAIIALTEFLLEEGVTDQTQEDLRALRTSGLHLHSLLDSVLDLSKIEAGELNIECLPCSLSEVLSECGSIVRSQAREKELELRLALPELPIPTVLGDAARLRQVVLNLLNNALKFTDKGFVEIKLCTSSPTPELLALEICVRDTGIGIAANDLETIFEPFFQSDDSVNRAYTGMGSGLTISRKLIRLMGGQISVRSELGKGSEFTLALNLPVANPARKASSLRIPVETRSPFAETSPETRPHVLVVDDNALNRKVLERFLKRLGVTVESVDSGEGCLEILETKPFELVFMDVQMPGIDGLEATRRIRQRFASEPPRLPIIAVTAHAMKGDRERCLAAGMNDYLSKPISLEALARALEQYGASSTNKAPC